MISYVSSQTSQKSNLIHEEDVNKIVRSPLFKRKDFESLQKQQQKQKEQSTNSNLIFNKTEFINSKSQQQQTTQIKKAHNQGNLNDRQKSLIQKVSQGFDNKYSPKLSNEGEGGGVYFLSGPNSGDVPVGVFKPRDEENGLFSENINVGADVKPNTTNGMKSGTLRGEGSFKEVAVYMFDQLHGGIFHVPATTLVEVRHPTWNWSKKVGSLQEFIAYEDTAEEIGSSKFTVEDIHRIGLLDCLIFNCDRHFGNLLAVSSPKLTGINNGTTIGISSDQESFEDYGDQDDSASSISSISSLDDKLELVPIDHSLCLPNSDILSDAWFDWINYPQSKEPFSEFLKELIMSIDPDSDIQQLHSRLPKLKLTSLETLKISTLFVKSAITNNLTLYQIGKLMSRFDNLDSPSTLELILNNTKSKLNIKSNPNSNKPIKLYNQLFWSTFQNEINQFFIQFQK